MRIDARYNQIPTDSDASIYTQGLLGGKFIGLTAGGAETYLKDKDQIDFTQSAFVLENLIGQVLANFAKNGGQADSGKSKTDAPAEPKPIGENEMIKFTIAAMSLALMGGRRACRGSHRRRPPRASTLGPAGAGGEFREAHAGGVGRQPADVCEGSGQARCAWWRMCCCRISTREYAARLVLGQTWRTATPEQRKRFVDAFYHSLLHNYGAALVDFTADRFMILPYKGDPSDTTATVRTEVKRSSGDKVPGQFQLAQNGRGVESLGCGHRGHLLRQEFQHRFRLGDSAKRSGRSNQPARSERQSRAERRTRGDQPLMVRRKYGGSGQQDASFEVLEGDRARAVGSLHFSTVSALLDVGADAIETGRAAVIDLGAVTASDSSGLALLIEWLSVAKAAGRELRFENIPTQLQQLARLSEVEELLVPG